MPRISDVYPSKFLRASDIGQARAVVEIEDVRLEDVGGDRRLVARFRGRQKAMTLNKTNALALQEITGSDNSDDWAGVHVRLSTSQVTYQGRLVDALRIGPAEPAAPPARPPAPRDADPFSDAGDDIGF